MRSEVRYAITGIFILVLSIAMIGLVMWMALGTEQRDTNRYVIYLHESVSGLTEKAPVKMQGVDVGQVYSIRLDPENPQRVEILVDIYEGTPVVVGTRSQLIMSAITSIGYIELSGGFANANPVLPKDDALYPEIPSKPSLPSRLEGAFETLTDRVEKVSRRLTSALSVDNVNNFSDTLANIAFLTEQLSDPSGELQMALANINALTASLAGNGGGDIAGITADIKKISSNLVTITDGLAAEDGPLNTALNSVSSISGVVDGSSERIENILASAESITTNLDRLSANIADLSDRLDKSMDMLDSALSVVSESTRSIGKLATDGAVIVKRFGQQMMPALQGTLNELDRLSEDGQVLIERLIDKPSSIIFGHEATPPGPGE